MKKATKILLTILFVAIAWLSIVKLTSDFSNDRLLFTVLSFVLFAVHLFAWIAPRAFFNLCWKITNIMPDNFDYDKCYSKLELVDIGILITSISLLGISLLFQ